MKRQLAFLGVYSFLAPSFFLIHENISVPKYIICFAILMLCLAGILLTVYYMCCRKPKEIVAGLPALVELGTCISIIIIINQFNMYNIVLSYFISIYIGAHCAILYYEDIPLDLHCVELMHHRYIEYLRTFFWIFVFILAGWIYWELQAGGFHGLTGLVLIQTGLQIFGIMTGGGAIAIYAFHNKLIAIEQKQK